MSDEKKYTERDLILSERTGIDKAVSWFFREMRRAGCRHIEELDARHLSDVFAPLPKVTRLRVVHDDADKCEYRAVGGMIQRRDEWQEWYVVNDTALSERRIRLWADLLQNPTETVEDEA